MHNGLMRFRALILLCAMLGVSGCMPYRMPSECPTVPQALTEPLPPLSSPVDSSCGALLNSYMDNLKTCAIWGARYQSLVEAVSDDRDSDLD